MGKNIFLLVINSFVFFLSWEVFRVKHRRVKQQHSGEIFGFTSCLARFPNDDACIIILSNIESISIDDLVEALTNILFEEK